MVIFLSYIYIYIDMDTGPESPKFRYSKNLQGRPTMIHNLKSAINLEKSSIPPVEETRKSYWKNPYKNERKPNYPGLVQKIKYNREHKPKVNLSKSLNIPTRKMISQKAKNGLKFTSTSTIKEEKKKNYHQYLVQG